ncbi:hypothetical protein NCCP2222_02470 [Sporosarcina sp. NCCP-2222]|uniref:DUF456 domain-containing protein n=1 Tax=Sporosarcina sp. NCCP-2222 TaxID=2935073 RepID=UPI00208B8522|nr:DUF456 family protein [Sporosarcina sp. NCCP-2222]GKV54300.1 hypothetical protein NCCP2222_02470 [Sporosarcina sp. NCCP-2222]
MEWIGWIVAIIFFLVAFAGLIYPIIPSVVFIVGGFLLYGWIVSFDEMNWLFWLIQILFVVLLFSADTLANLVGVKRFGGSKAGMWGSTIGLLAGPFVIPVAGILLGPFIGAVLAELIVSRSGLKQSLLTGIGSLVGFLTSVLVKGGIMLVMIAIFILFVAK